MTPTVDPVVAAQILGLPMEPNAAYASTVRDYLITLLATVWAEGERFSGKRPFGDSGWKHDLYQPLMAAGLVETTLDSWGDQQLSTEEGRKADRLIAAAIQEL